MIKKIIINNMIVLAVYVLSVYRLSIAASSFSALYRTLAPNTKALILGCIAAFLYILCGFFLIQVGKRSFLSVVSIAIALVVILIILIMLRDAALGYYALNLIANSLQYFNFPICIEYIVFFLSPVYPSLLFYLGMVLRRLIVRR